MGDKKITHLCRWLILLKFTRFLGGPNGPKICGGRTKTDFKDREVAPLGGILGPLKSDLGVIWLDFGSFLLDFTM